MKVLFMISHPAHFHMFRNTMGNLENHGHQVVVVIRPKDMLEQLCIDADVTYYRINERPNKFGLFGLGISLIEKVVDVTKIVYTEKPDLLVGSDGVLAYAGTICRVSSFEFFEDDYSIIKLYAKLFFPFYSHLVCPFVCDAGKWDYKKIGYEGYQKLAYLHPNYFLPDKRIVEKYFSVDESPYYIIRFAKLAAHHDVGVKGFNLEVARRVIRVLSENGRVYITSEGTLPQEFEQYRLRINPLDIHHVLAFASLYIGDSQSMAVEACMLGTPCIRFNDFVGKKKISVLEELEQVYCLTNGISSNDSHLLYKKIEEILAMPDARSVYQERRKKMLADKIDVTQYWTWFLENYPKSTVQYNEKDEFWKQFK